MYTWRLINTEVIKSISYRDCRKVEGLKETYLEFFLKSFISPQIKNIEFRINSKVSQGKRKNVTNPLKIFDIRFYQVLLLNLSLFMYHPNMETLEKILNLTKCRRSITYISFV